MDMQVEATSPLSVAAFALAACGCTGSDDGTFEAPEHWELLAGDQPSALLSIWGASESDVWVVGGDDRSEGARGPLVLHYDGSAWESVDSGVRSVDLWWVFGFDAGPIFFAGSNGTILRRSSEGGIERMPTPDNGIVFGMWGAAPDEPRCSPSGRIASA